MMYWSGHMSAGGWILSILWTLIIIALVVAGIVWLMTALSGRDTAPSTLSAPESSAREILDRRLARGELTIADYERLRETINGPATDSDTNKPAHRAGAPG